MAITEATQKWVESVVIELNLCPFAKRELINHRVRFYATEATLPEQLLGCLQGELERLEYDASIETTLLIHPDVLQDFAAYNQFLDLADALLIDLNLEGIFQIASFHPDYQFAGSEADDVENYTNRSPYPMLHLIREQSLARALENYPDAENIPKRNIELLNKLGLKKMQELLQRTYLVD